MKKRQRAQSRRYPRLRHSKAKGEWAELVFMAKAIGLGFTVSRPYGDNQPFDFLVFCPGSKVSRVQVKSSWTKSDKVYRFKATGFGGRRYRRGEVDFLVVFVVPEDAWYVIPRRQARYESQYVAPHNPRSRAQWEKYREAWDLLRGCVPGYGIELQACADPNLTAEIAEDAEEIHWPRINADRSGSESITREDTEEHRGGTEEEQIAAPSAPRPVEAPAFRRGIGDVPRDSSVFSVPPWWILFAGAAMSRG